jgi:hypothetical protein
LSRSDDGFAAYTMDSIGLDNGVDIFKHLTDSSPTETSSISIGKHSGFDLE